MMLFFLTACIQTESPDQLSIWPSDPYALLKRCEKEEIKELQIACRIQAAANFGAINEEHMGVDICKKIEPKVWNEECHFRLGEELAYSGNLMAGYFHCSMSNHYAENCFAHIKSRREEILAIKWSEKDKHSIEGLQEIHLKLIEETKDNIFNVSKKLKTSLLADLTSQFGISVYLGRGSLDISPTDTRGLLGASLRTGYAMEAARLLHLSGKASVENIIEAWNEPTRIDTVATKTITLHGRHHSGLISPYEKNLDKINLYGGGTRLISDNPQEDITIAALEAIYWLEETPGESFIPWIGNQSDLIRLTAAKLLRLSMTPELSKSPQLIQATSKADRKVQWYFKQNLSKKKHRITRPQ